MNSLTDADIRTIIGRPTNAYDTHRPLLAEAILRTSGAILELGMGEGSTPSLHEINRLTGRGVTSYEDDAEWFKKMAYPNPKSWNPADGQPHLCYRIYGWDDAAIDSPNPVDPSLWSPLWSVALVDHGQIDRRVREIGRLANNTEIVVVHDTEDVRYRYWTIYGLFKYRFDYMKIRPWTTAFSNSIDVSQWQIP